MSDCCVFFGFRVLQVANYRLKLREFNFFRVHASTAAYHVTSTRKKLKHSCSLPLHYHYHYTTTTLPLPLHYHYYPTTTYHYQLQLPPKKTLHNGYSQTADAK
jgi:hypothetical protein